MVCAETFVNGSRIPLLRDHVDRLGRPSPAAMDVAAAKREAAFEYEYLANRIKRRVPALAIIGMDIMNIYDPLLAELLLLLLAICQYDKLHLMKHYALNK